MTAVMSAAASTLLEAAVSTERFLAGMRQFAAGCTIIAARHGGARAGLTATAMCSVTADPPRLLVCVNQKVRAHALIAASEALSVNVLSRSHEPLAKRFAGMVDGVAGDDRFQGADWTERVTGAPLLQDALAAFDCRVVEAVHAGSHRVFLCQVVDVLVAADPSAHHGPLLYVDGHFATVA